MTLPFPAAVKSERTADAWVLYDKVRLGAKIPKEAKLIHQERAYTSPIWYTP
jgi:hypothetical protein